MLARTVTRLALLASIPALLVPAAGATGDTESPRPAVAAADAPAVSAPAVSAPAVSKAVRPAAREIDAREASTREAVQRVAGVAGMVSGQRASGRQAPLSSVKVYVYRLHDLELSRAVTDERGHFRFDALPAGLYKVIAHKPGFLPAVVQLTRATAQAYQFLDVELAEAGPREAETPGDDFWSLRSQVPDDVLREIQVLEIERSTRMAAAVAPQQERLSRLAAEMRAATGVDETAPGREGQLTRGEVGIRGELGGVHLGVTGDYTDLRPGVGDAGAGAPSGFARGLTVSVASDDDMTVRLSSRTDRLVASPETRQEAVDFENYRLAVSHAVGDKGRSDFVAQYTTESNFHRHGWLDPETIPEASRSWRIEGTYTAELNEKASLQTGLRYRERTSAFGFDTDTDRLLPEQQRVDLFGRAGMQIQPSVLVEYGLYTTLRDGSLSLSPRGGLVMQLSANWQAAAAASYKIHDEARDRQTDYFMPTQRHALETAEDACEQNEGHCYQLVLTHQQGEDASLSLGATHRRFDETQRLYFSDDLIDRYESLFLVPGDEMPELQVAVTRRLSPKVLARLESNLAEGGGGVFYATDSEAYENQVRYLVTSLDTHFDGTATGLFIAFHHLEQTLLDLQPNGRPAPTLEVERLELMLTQDLNILLDMATDMAVHLNMQVSRGSWPFLADDPGREDREELRKRLVGGIAFRF